MVVKLSAAFHLALSKSVDLSSQLFRNDPELIDTNVAKLCCYFLLPFRSLEAIAKIHYTIMIMFLFSIQI